MPQSPAHTRRTASRTGLGLALVTAMTAGTASQAAAVPAHPAAPTVTPRPVTERVAASALASAPAAGYVVQRGDTVYAIAAKTGTSAAAIIAANGLGPNAVIHPGQTLTLSGTGSAGAPSSATTSARSAGGSYTVQRGDTVYAIAAKTGISAAAIIAANGLGPNAVIHPGQTLKLSGTGSAGGSPNRVGSTFQGRTYADDVVSAANRNAANLDAGSVPSRARMQQIVRETAIAMGVDPALALAHAKVESEFDQRAVSPANAVGVMQVIPSSGQWASDLVGRKLNLLDPYDNAVAGVAIIRQLHRMESDPTRAIAGYYQGLGSVRKNGLYRDTVAYVNKVQSVRAQFR